MHAQRRRSSHPTTYLSSATPGSPASSIEGATQLLAIPFSLLPNHYHSTTAIMFVMIEGWTSGNAAAVTPVFAVPVIAGNVAELLFNDCDPLIPLTATPFCATTPGFGIPGVACRCEP